MSTKPSEASPLQQAQQKYEQLVASIDGIVWESDAQMVQFSVVSRQAERCWAILWNNGFSRTFG